MPVCQAICQTMSVFDGAQAITLRCAWDATSHPVKPIQKFAWDFTLSRPI